MSKSTKKGLPCRVLGASADQCPNCLKYVDASKSRKKKLTAIEPQARCWTADALRVLLGLLATKLRNQIRMMIHNQSGVGEQHPRVCRMRQVHTGKMSRLSQQPGTQHTERSRQGSEGKTHKTRSSREVAALIHLVGLLAI